MLSLNIQRMQGSSRSSGLNTIYLHVMIVPAQRCTEMEKEVMIKCYGIGGLSDYSSPECSRFKKIERLYDLPFVHWYYPSDRMKMKSSKQL